MITTVTTVTTTTVTTFALGGALGAVAVVALILMLIARELSTAEAENQRAGGVFRALSLYLLAPILSLLMVFAIVVAVKVFSVL